MEEIKQELRKYAEENTDKFKYFHKTDEGGYAFNDKFLGITVPNIRKVAKEFVNKVQNEEVVNLLRSMYHEERLCALIILVLKMKTKSFCEKEKILELYLENTKYVNGWDLVDLSAPYILGNLVLEDKSMSKYIYMLAKSKNMWEQRIAIVSNLTLIRKGEFKYLLDIADSFLDSKYDLIHKAVGWTLREIGKKDFNEEYNYLLKNYTKMPRTMLRYAIERFDEPLRQKFLKGEIKCQT